MLGRSGMMMGGLDLGMSLVTEYTGPVPVGGDNGGNNPIQYTTLSPLAKAGDFLVVFGMHKNGTPAAYLNNKRMGEDVLSLGLVFWSRIDEVDLGKTVSVQGVYTWGNIHYFIFRPKTPGAVTLLYLLDETTQNSGASIPVGPYITDSGSDHGYLGVGWVARREGSVPDVSPPGGFTKLKGLDSGSWFGVHGIAALRQPGLENGSTAFGLSFDYPNNQEAALYAFR